MIPVRDLVDALLAAADRAELERIGQALNEIRALHAPYIEQGTTAPVCIHCCCTRSGFTDVCLISHVHGPGEPICPTAAILDRAGL